MFWKIWVSIISIAVLCIFIAMLMCESYQNLKEGRPKETELQSQMREATYGTSELSSCNKTNSQNTFVICKVLPYTNTHCGDERDKRADFAVPNLVHFVWYGDMELQYYQYLAIRSAAANQKPSEIMLHINGSKPRGVWWNRVQKEIPCLRIVKSDAPAAIFGNNISNILHMTDITRILVLLKYGGIYLDSDAIVLRSLDPLRKFPFTIGRSTEHSLSNSVMLSEPNSTFLLEWLSLFTKFDKNKVKGIHFADFGVKLPMRMLIMKPDLNVHVEEFSLQRPNPWSEGRSCISHGSYDISRNYVLHLHPQKSLKRDPRVLLDYRENELRVYDATYGAGARAALFGTQDMIFLEPEVSYAHNRKDTEKILKYPRISQYSL